MKRLKYLLTLFAVSATLYGCGSSNADSTSSQVYSTASTPEAPPAPEPEPAKILNVYDPDGNSVNLTIDPNTMYCNMATWCPHCDQLIKNIRNPRYTNVFSSRKIIFLFSKSELKDYVDGHEKEINDMAVENGLTAQELRERLRSLMQQQDQASPEMFDRIPSSIKYYFYDKEFKYETGGIPEVYSFRTNSFSESPYEWLGNKDESQIPIINSMNM
jgi:hypothetical protein